MNASGYQPVDQRILVLPDPVEEVTKGGIIRPDVERDRAKYAGTLGTLVAKGDNAFIEWGDGALKPEPGARVHFAQFTGARIKGKDDQDYIVMNDEDLTLVEVAQ